MPGVAVYFVTLQQLQYLVLVAHRRGYLNGFYDKEQRKLTTIGNLTIGAISRTFAGTLLMPATVLKVRFESSQYRYNGISSACLSIWNESGFRGFFRGLGVTALRDAPNAGLYLAFYEGLKGITGESAAGTMAAGSVAGLMATICTQPFDLAKTRVQLAKERSNFLSVIGAVVKKEGVAGLFNGIGPRLLRKSLSQAITWTVYEQLIRWNRSP